MQLTLPPGLTDLLMRDVMLSDNGIAVLSPHNIFLFHNDAFARMFGFGAQSMIGRSYDHMMEWIFTHGGGPRIEAPTLREWLDYVHSRLRSQRFRSFEVDLVDGHWLLLTEQVHEGGEVVMLCSDITRQKKIELDLKQAHAELERQAMTDHLTGIPNRRHFLRQLEQEIERARRYRHPMCVAMLDLDHFKKINDQYGHPAGDAVLRHFTAFLRGQLRQTDMLGRVGGEEFAVMFPETRLDDALFVLRRVVDRLALEAVDAVAPGFHYTFSGGVAAADGITTVACNWLLGSADQALYRAKDAGRNRVLPYEAAAG